ncbi:MAG TPA: hypothetical protein VFF06_17930, partial [Polyangia bacterium]|nr:hypothetical protein [Polyangia bacterium]
MTVLPQPIPLALSERGGALVASASVDEIPVPFPVVIDTGSPITAYHKVGGADADVSYGHIGLFRLYAAGAGAPPRLEIQNIQLYQTELRSVGRSAFPVGGVLGGDNLERFAIGLDYRGGAPAMTLVESILACSCQLANDCQAVFPFQLLGGQEQIALGTNLYTYPATRVVLDACLEPEPDPVSAGLPCATNALTLPPTNERYQPHGVDVKLIVATGFPGFALGAGAYDRLRGQGAAAQALASPVRLHLPDVDDDGPNAEGLAVGVGQLGGPGVSALAVVSRELYLGPCAELARSRRMRRSPQGRSFESACLETPNSPLTPSSPLPCGNIPNQPAACDDTTAQAHVASILELTQTVPIYVVDDAAPLLQSVNADVRPGAATVEGLLGTEVLARLVSTIDYPHSRFIARCASDADCLWYPRYIVSSEQGDCEDPNTCTSPNL